MVSQILNSNGKASNLLIGFFSIVFGFFLWLYVLSTAETKGIKIVKINYKLPDGIAISNKYTQEIRYKINGPRIFIRSLLRESKEVVIDVREFWQKGKMLYTFDTSDFGVNFPFSVDITEIEPSKINIELEPAIEKRLKVNLNLEGSIPSDHKLVRKELKPDTISVYGPESILKNMSLIETSLVDISGINESGSLKVKLKNYDPRLELSDEEVDLLYVVKPTRANLILKNIPIRFLSPYNIKKSSANHVNLMVLADNEDTLKYSKEDIKVMVDIPLDVKGNISLPIEVSLPKGLHLLEVEPSQIDIEVDKSSK